MNCWVYDKCMFNFVRNCQTVFQVVMPLQSALVLNIHPYLFVYTLFSNLRLLHNTLWSVSITFYLSTLPVMESRLSTNPCHHEPFFNRSPVHILLWTCVQPSLGHVPRSRIFRLEQTLTLNWTEGHQIPTQNGCLYLRGRFGFCGTLYLYNLGILFKKNTKLKIPSQVQKLIFIQKKLRNYNRLLGSLKIIYLKCLLTDVS